MRSQQASTGLAQAPPELGRVLEVGGLSIAHREHGRRRLLVGDVSFGLGYGETIGIVGESGSGKSMTALAMLGLLPRNVHATGSVRFEGQELVGQRERFLRQVRGGGISLLLQDPSTMLNPLRRCITHVEEGLSARRTVRDRRCRREEALRRLAEVDIGADAALRYPFQVSGGMAQRVGLAAALAGDPKVLIADEPTTALDVTIQREILELLKLLRARRRMSMILITHDLRVAFEVCDRLYIMYSGTIVEYGPPNALSRDPLHPYTRGLLLCEPDMQVRRRRLNVIAGNVPAADEVVDCCSFSTRCQWCTDKCTAQRPPLIEVRPHRATACVRIDEIYPEFRATAERLETEVSVVHDAHRGEPSLLTVSKLEKEFPERTGTMHRVLHAVDLTVRPGEAVGLVGESGSGKTTLARCVVGLETPTSGTIGLDGVDVSDYDQLRPDQRTAARRAVQMVFQNPYASLNPALTVSSTLSEAVTLSGAVDDVVGRIRDLLEQVGLPASYARRRPAALSGGERQRVAIARGLAVGPRLLICDEPTSALDVSVQAQVLNLLRQLQQELSLGLLFITHNLAIVRQVADHLYVISEGRFVEEGPTAKVLDDPGHEYTRLLLDSVPSGSSHDVPPTTVAG